MLCMFPDSYIDYVSGLGLSCIKTLPHQERVAKVKYTDDSITIVLPSYVSKKDLVGRLKKFGIEKKMLRVMT